MRKQAVTFYAQGCKLMGDLYRPDDLGDGETRAGILLCHGYTGVKGLYLPDNAAALVAEGYVVLAFDYKGWGESEGPKSHLNPHDCVADAQAALTFKGYGHYEVYSEPAFSEVMRETIAWYQCYVPARLSVFGSD